jgi:hypothetical protein
LSIFFTLPTIFIKTSYQPEVSEVKEAKTKFWSVEIKKNLEGVASGSILGGNIPVKPMIQYRKLLVLTKHQQTI